MERITEYIASEFLGEDWLEKSGIYENLKIYDKKILVFLLKN